MGRTGQLCPVYCSFWDILSFSVARQQLEESENFADIFSLHSTDGLHHGLLLDLTILILFSHLCLGVSISPRNLTTSVRF
jgi:hypothetical protein